MTDRQDLVAAARDIIAAGSHSFAAASRLFAPAVRERAWLLYAWCRTADDMVDGQELGHAADPQPDPQGAQMALETMTAAALDGDAPVSTPFAALRQVASETAMPRRYIDDHLAGFALDAQGWRPQSEADLMRYCYHVAGAVGCMMAVVMGVSAHDEDTLDRACDLGLAFQLANIARDVVPDAAAGRCYLPDVWLREAGLAEADLLDPANRTAVAGLARRLILLAQGYRRSARIGAARLPFRSRLAVLAADGIYGAIGERVLKRKASAWDRRVRIGPSGKAAQLVRAAWLSLAPPPAVTRSELWTRPR